MTLTSSNSPSMHPKMHPNMIRSAAALASSLLLSATASAQLVVGSGDVSTEAVVLFAKSEVAGELLIEYSTDPRLALDVSSVRVVVKDPQVPTRELVTRLKPGTQYYLRATSADGAIASGRFRTLDPLGARPAVRIATTTDWQQSPPFVTLSNLPDRNPDVILKLGDTIYADAETRGLPGVVQARTLEQFRIKHREIISSAFGIPGDDFMTPVLAAAPLFATIDDHEIVDNFAGGAAPGESPDAPLVNPGEPPLFTDPVEFVNQTQAYIDALQAFAEHHPVVDEVWSGTGDPRVDGRPKLYRHRTLGSTASITLLDSRSFRDVQLPPVANPLDPASVGAFLASTFTPGRTLLGGPQLAQLKSDLLADQQAGVTWKLVVIPEPIQNFGVVNAEDRFEGYAAERTELLAFIEQAEIDNVVFVSGDFHGTIVNNLAYQVPTAQGLLSVPIPAFEVVTGPVAFFSGRFGPAVANIALAAGIISPQQFAFYESLDTAGKDQFVRTLVDAQVVPLGYSPVGLEDSTLDAELLEGAYFAAHGFSWTEFDIDDAETLEVTTWSIEAFDDATAEADPAAVLALGPQIVSRFRVHPTRSFCADLNGDGAVDGTDLGLLLVQWGGAGSADLNGDGTVDGADLALLLSTWESVVGCASDPRPLR
jgi:phosphodiesterase/alkaline phosphatase D-like protein